MKTTFKKPLTVKEQIGYLEENKKVVFHDVSKEEAESILYQNNYINVISPYKRRFYKKDKSGKGIKDVNGHYIYERETDFQEYKDAYFNERNKYPKIYKNIMKFESTMNAIVSYEVINGYKIETMDKFEEFIRNMKMNVDDMNVSEGTKQHYFRSIEEISNAMEKYEDIYILFDRMSLSQMITVYKCVGIKIHNSIFRGMLKAKATFGYSSPGTFDVFLNRVVPIRNCICHFNSLEILVKYFNIRTRELRRASDHKIYLTIINKLSLE